MKTKEFINEVEALGYEVSHNWGTIYINRAGFTILDLGYLEEWDIDVDYPGFDEMRWDDKKELMTIVSEYMLTDPKDREEEKRYYLRLAANLSFYMDETYLNYNPIKAKYFVSNKFEKDSSTAIFTESEIAEMDITGFKKEPVE